MVDREPTNQWNKASLVRRAEIKKKKVDLKVAFTHKTE